MYSSAQWRLMLILAEEHIRQGNEHIAAMERLVAGGERDLLDTAQAKFLLAGFRAMQFERERRRTRIVQNIVDLS